MTAHTLLQVTAIKRTMSHMACLTSPEPDNEQCSSTFLFPFTCGPAARRASLAEVKASLGFAGCCSFAFLPPALAAEAARLFGGMILAKDPAQKLAVVIMWAWRLDKLRHALTAQLTLCGCATTPINPSPPHTCSYWVITGQLLCTTTTERIQQ